MINLYGSVHCYGLDMSIITDGLNSTFNKKKRSCLINVLFFYFNVNVCTADRVSYLVIANLKKNKIVIYAITIIIFVNI